MTPAINKNAVLILMLTWFVSLGCLNAQVVVPIFSYNSVANINPGIYKTSTSAGTISVSNANDSGTSFSSVSIGYGNAPTLESQSSLAISQNLGEPGYPDSNATVTYYIEVLGPTNISVPVTIAESGSVSGDMISGDTASAYFLVGGSASGSASVSGLAELPTSVNPGNLTFSLNQDLTLRTNLLDIVTMEVSSGSGSPDGGSEEASLNSPHFEIDPTFASANPGYSIEVSDAAPEPPSWLLISLGMTIAWLIYLSEKQIRLS
jgi:hypothetical protein